MNIPVPMSCVSIAIVSFVVLTGCGGSTSSSLSGNARFLNGPTSRVARTGSKVRRGGRLADGTWYLTPNEMTLKVVGISFQTSSGSSSSTTVDCDIPTSQSQASLATLKDCAFSVAPGTYSRVSIQVSTNVRFKISDTTNGLYSNSSATNLLETSGSAETVTVDLGSCGNPPCQESTETFSSNFSPALNIQKASDATLYVVVDPTHFLSIVSSGGTFTGKPSKSGTDLPLIPFVSEAGKVEFYTNTGTSLNVNTSTVTTTPQAGETPTGIRLYCTSSGQPAKVNIRYGYPTGGACGTSSHTSAWPAAPVSGGGTANFGIAGYLGMDSSRVISWVEALDSDWTSFGILYEMTRASLLGNTTVLQFQCGTTMPTPTSGSNFSSGAPAITATGSRHLKLVAE